MKTESADHGPKTPRFGFDTIETLSLSREEADALTRLVVTLRNHGEATSPLGSLARLDRLASEGSGLEQALSLGILGHEMCQKATRTLELAQDRDEGCALPASITLTLIELAPQPPAGRDIAERATIVRLRRRAETCMRDAAENS